MQTSRRVLSVGHHRDFVSPAVRRRVQAGLLVERAGQEKEGRALRLNLAGRHREVEHKLRAVHRKAERGPNQPSAQEKTGERDTTAGPQQSGVV